jgi:hypothetical protein
MRACRHFTVKGLTQGFVRLAGLVLIGLLCATIAPSARAESDTPLIFNPASPGPGNTRFSVGGLWMVAPQFTANFRYGLPAGFSLDARILTVLVRNELDIGAAWSAQAGPLQLGVGLHVGGWFGGLGNYGGALSTQFAQRGWGMVLQPNVSAGMKVASDSWLTLQFETFLSPYQAVSLDGFVITPEHASVYNGYGVTATVEYAIGGPGILYYGVGLYNTTANYPLFINAEYSPKMIAYVGALAGYEF